MSRASRWYRIPIQPMARLRLFFISLIALLATVTFCLSIVGVVLTEPYQNDSYDSPGDSASDISRSLHRLFGVYIGGIVLSALTVLMILGLAREQIALNGARKGRSSRLPVFGLPLLWEQLLLVAWWAGWLVLADFFTLNDAVRHCRGSRLPTNFCNLNKTTLGFLWATYFCLVMFYTVTILFCAGENQAGFKDVWSTSFAKYREYAARRSEQNTVAGRGVAGAEAHNV